MAVPVLPPAGAGKRICGICGKPLSQYNKDDICMSHKAGDVAAYREKAAKQVKESRAIAAFVREFHGESTAAEMLQVAATKRQKRSVVRKEVLSLDEYAKALGLLKSASRVFRLSMFSVLRLTSTNKKYKIAREVLIYLMSSELKMELEDIGTFLGYTYLPNVRVSIDNIRNKLLEDEDIILAVDLVLNEYLRVELNTD